ncbi:MAG: HEPN domain-containing protein [Chloroflexales bacterium]
MMDAKAKQNLQAAEVLVAQGFFDSAASRAYYAAYLAGWSWLAAAGQEPDEDYWRHTALPQVLFDWAAIADEQKDDLRFLFNQRVKADYYEDAIQRSEAEELLQIARGLIGHLLEAA